MSGGLRIKVRLRGRLGPELQDMLGDFDARVVPRHTVLSVASGDLRDLGLLLARLDRADIELDQVLTRR